MSRAVRRSLGERCAARRWVAIRRARYIAPWLCMLAAAFGLGAAPSPSAGVAHVGAVALGAREIQRRAARLAPFQIAALGSTWPEQRSRLLHDELIPDALLESAAAHETGLYGARDRALVEALGAELRARTPAPTPASIRAYYDQHRAQYEQPRSLLLWRILVAHAGDVDGLLEELEPLDESKWSLLARERSLDDATNMRAGSLGYVFADGRTHMPTLRVSPGLFAAAAQVADGQLVPHAVPDAGGFALIWRRASREASSRSFVDVAPQIAALLFEQSTASASAALL
ncbi:MAG TPA: peptidylprolyl isomerase, partial [Polyangiaceae bacterium]|nr:peptidylprolyl isomerase [Polyangiaceae bacterium]